MGESTALIVTAHPDDEAMFFGPTIQQLLREGVDIHMLCLSTGNADGLGTIRHVEMLRACEALGVPSSNVTIKDHQDLQDGMSNLWDEGLIAHCIADAMLQSVPTMVISFDAYGVSGHPNHRAVHRGFLRLMRDTCDSDGSGPGRPNFEAWQLVSTGILRKFMCALDIPLSLCEAAAAAGCITCHVATSPLRIVRAMAQHRSQWVWFRKLFILFSRHTYVNTLQRVST